MIPARSIATLAISLAALLFVAWLSRVSSGGLYEQRSATQEAALVDPGPHSAR
jgi:hypothetical protein